MAQQTLAVCTLLPHGCQAKVAGKRPADTREMPGHAARPASPPRGGPDSHPRARARAELASTQSTHGRILNTCHFCNTPAWPI